MSEDQSRIADLEAKLNILIEYHDFITKHIEETLSKLTPTLDPPHD